MEEQSFQFGCLIETRVKESKAQRLSNILFKDWSVMTNYECNRRGRIWVIWKKNVRLSPFFKSSQVITCSVKLENQEEEFFLFICLCVKFRGGKKGAMDGHESSL